MLLNLTRPKMYFLKRLSEVEYGLKLVKNHSLWTALYNLYKILLSVPTLKNERKTNNKVWSEANRFLYTNLWIFDSTWSVQTESKYERIPKLQSIPILSKTYFFILFLSVFKSQSLTEK